MNANVNTNETYQEGIARRKREEREELFANVEQVIERGVLIIRPLESAPERVKSMFACGSVPIRANDVWTPPDTGAGTVHFETETSAPWGMVRKVRGLAVAHVTEGRYPNTGRTLEIRIYGVRSLQHPRESGYAMEGRVSVSGETHRAFTSSTLFEREDGSLIDVATLYVCGIVGEK